MWAVALMSVLMLGAILGTDQAPVEEETDAPTEPDDMSMEPDPVVPIVTEEPVTEAPVVEEPVTETPDPVVEPVVDPAPTGQTLTYTGDVIIVGSEGDDTLLGSIGDDILGAGVTTQVDLLEGDDFAQLALEGLIADGGTGNDTIQGLALGATINGGTGDDVISGRGDTSLNGGEGNDTIDVLLEDPLDAMATVSGGAGNDLLRLNASIGAGGTDAASATLSGDAGADLFDLNLELTDQAPVADGPTTISSDPNVRILDFDASEDLLQIEILRPEGAEDRDISVTTLARSEAGDDGLGPFTTITLTFAGSETALEVTSSFTVFSEEPFTAADIIFVEATAAA